VSSALLLPHLCDVAAAAGAAAAAVMVHTSASTGSSPATTTYRHIATNVSGHWIRSKVQLHCHNVTAAAHQVWYRTALYNADNSGITLPVRDPFLLHENHHYLLQLLMHIVRSESRVTRGSPSSNLERYDSA
jgi:hypothetical protein